DVGGELELQMRLRKVFMFLDDARLEELVGMMAEPGTGKLLESFGDIDYPTILAKVLWRHAPELYKFSGPALRSVFVEHPGYGG
ncbi:MAG: hypothetical protein ACT4PT_08285, partial [Methanobacteriota archaeon]